MQADLHAARFPYVLIIYSLPVVFVCNALFLFLLLCFHMYKPQTNLVNVCAQLISLRNEHFFGDTFVVLCFHMYKLQAYFENIYVLRNSSGESHAMTTPSICCVFICTNPNQTSILGSGGNLQLPRAKKKLIELSFKILSHLLAWSGPIDLRFEQGLLEVCTYEKPTCQSFAT